MDTMTAVVIIFGMLFALLAAVTYSYHKLESLRLRTGYCSDNKPTDDNDSEGEVIHAADRFVIGATFKLCDGSEVLKNGVVIDKPTRDTLRIKWIPVEAGETVTYTNQVQS